MRACARIARSARQTSSGDKTRAKSSCEPQAPWAHDAQGGKKRGLTDSVHIVYVFVGSIVRFIVEIVIVAVVAILKDISVLVNGVICAMSATFANSLSGEAEVHQFAG